ncbi:MAG: hypothetical protein RIF33_24995 [Cyclobacteriaceae bacterium]
MQNPTKNLFVFSALFLLNLSVIQNTFAQGYAANVSLGLGNVVGFNHPQGKIQLGIMCVRSILEDRVQMGIEISMGGNFIPGESVVDDINGVEIIDATNANWMGIQYKGRYFIAGESLRPFIGLGIGANNYWFNVNTVEDETVNRWNFGFTPEIGLGIDKFNLALRYIFGGTTPDFNGTRPVEYGGNEVAITSESLNLILLTFGYTFSFGG